MALQGTILVTVHAVKIKEGSLFSNAIGFDHDGNPIDFIDHTSTLLNVKKALEDFEEGDADGRPSVWLKPWQWEDNQ